MDETARIGEKLDRLARRPVKRDYAPTILNRSHEKARLLRRQLVFDRVREPKLLGRLAPLLA